MSELDNTKPRKVFISFLGTNDYAPCHYYKDNYKSEEIRFVQEATLQYLLQKGENESNPWTSNDTAIILLTQKAEMKNWNDNGHLDRQTQQPKKSEGLRTRLQKMNLPFNVLPLKGLKDGNNESEIWMIFKSLFGQLKFGDELYFDLTHGYRYLPMLVLVMGNYAKFLLDASVKHISYGNYEGRNESANEALLVDIFSFSDLQDWTFAAANYVRNGYADELKILSDKALNSLQQNPLTRSETFNRLKSIMRKIDELSSERQTCRGLQIWSGKKVKEIIEGYDALDEVDLYPLKPIVDKVVEGIRYRHLNNYIEDKCVDDGKIGLDNCLKAARWCFDNRLYQQTITILQEGFISYVCLRHHIDIEDKNARDFVNGSFSILAQSIDEKKWKAITDDREYDIEMYRKIIADQWVVNAVGLFSSITELRNDFNHCGFSNQAIKEASKVKKRVESILKQGEDLLLTE